ncbi:PREDICTED: vesicular glutamate transporter 1-like, partial [Branchiostoma belcheri]|uniref:Vesicular glutamate transporter 1-like n=1 Tax=Branchiostoma belcheri TaxID=7741 RepID=A0A6P4XPE4_BRABE
MAAQLSQQSQPRSLPLQLFLHSCTLFNTSGFAHLQKKDMGGRAEAVSTEAITTPQKLLCVLLFTAVLVPYAGRTSVSVILVELQTQSDNNTNTNVSKLQSQYSQFKVGVILSSVYIGLLPSSFIGGYLAYRYSALRVLLISVGASSIVHSLAPVMFQHFETAVIQRVLAGVAEKSIPFLSMVTSPAVWAFSLLNVASYIWDPSLLPLYFNQSFGANIELVGVLSGLPVLIFGFLEPIFALIGNQISKHVSTTATRKIMAVTSCLCVAGCLFVAAFTTDSVVAACFVTLGYGFSAARAAVADANAFDIAPRYASVLSGICRVLCRVAGLAFPLVVTALTKNKSTKEWSYVIIITACVFAATALFFGTFGSGKEQLWAQLDHNGDIQDSGNQRTRGSKKNDEAD